MFLLRFLLLSLSVAVVSSKVSTGGTTDGLPSSDTNPTSTDTPGTGSAAKVVITTKATSSTTKKTTVKKPGEPPSNSETGKKGGRNNDKSSPVSGWSIWALFWGFLAGMAVGAPISGGLLYACRRSVYSVWYRGIFTRYQCDVADTEANDKIEDDKNAGDSAMMTLGTELDTNTKMVTTTGGLTTTGAGTTATGTMTEATATTGATESKTKTPQKDETATGGGDPPTNDKLKTDD